MRLRKLIFAAMWLFGILAATPCVAAEPRPHSVLIIDESDPLSPFSRRFNDQIHVVLDAEKVPDYALYREYLDVGHFGDASHEAALKTYLAQKYRDRPIDVILALGTGAVNFVAHMREDLWPRVPIVFLSFDEGFTSPRSLGSNVTGIVVPRRLQYLVEAARLFVPNLGRVVLVGEGHERQPFRQHYEMQLQNLANELKLVDLTNRSLAEIKKGVADLPDDAVIVYTPLYNDPSGMTHTPAEALRAIAEVANRPIVVDSEALIGAGAAGGFVVSTEDAGREVGGQIARILKGESASAVPAVVKNFVKPVFDWRQLKRWDVSEATLPPGSVVLYREFTAWERYRWQIVGAIVVIGVQALIILALVYERRRRSAAERESHQHLLEVTKMDRALTVGTMSVSIAHELNQPLTAILSNAEAAEMLLDAAAPDRDLLKEILADIRKDNQRAVEIIRHLRLLLKQGEIDASEIDLKGVVSDTLEVVKPRADEQAVAVLVDLVAADLRVRADPVHLQQVLLNLAMNAIDAMQNTPVGERQLTLRVALRDSEVTVSVGDTGMGIPKDKLERIFEPFVTTKQQGTGLGLSIARTIISTYGGRIWAENRVGGSGAVFGFTLNLA